MRKARIMKDNTYGSIEEDAMRRDFTCNALYYDPIKEEIWDFHQGVADVANKKIGDDRRFLPNAIRKILSVFFVPYVYRASWALKWKSKRLCRLPNMQSV